MQTLLNFIGAIYDNRKELKESTKDLDVKIGAGLNKVGNILDKAAKLLQGRR